MKKTFIVLLVTFLSNVIFAQAPWATIGEIRNNSPVFTVNQATLLSSFNANYLALTGINGNFTTTLITAQPDGTFLLEFRGATFRASMFVRRKNLRLEALTTTSCTSSDCSTEARGCVVMYDKDDIGYCSPCSNGGQCTKISSGTSLILISPN